MPEKHSYIVFTEPGYSGSSRPDTRVDGVTEVDWEDDVLTLHDGEDLLFVAPMSQVVYVKRLDDGNVIRGNTVTESTINAEKIHIALMNLKRQRGGILGLS